MTAGLFGCAKLLESNQTGTLYVSLCLQLALAHGVSDSLNATLPTKLRSNMSTYVEITLWGGLPPPLKEDVVEAVGTFLAHPSMAEGAPAQTFFAELSTCHTTRHLIDKIRLHQHAPQPNAIHPRRRFNPSEYQITEIVVLKRRLLIQHEGFVFLVHHEPPAQHPHPTEPDFLIAIDLTHSNPFFSSPKLAIDRVDCSLFPAVPGVQRIEGTFGRPVVWRMPDPDRDDYVFNMTLFEVGNLLDAVLFSYPQEQYNALYKNCFSHSHILRTVIIRIIQEQQPGIVVAAQEPNEFGVTVGTCFGICLDRDQGEEAVVFRNYQGLLLP